MALTPWNRQEEWYQQMINASTGNYLPSISAQDAGKVMTVESDGSWGVENIPSELPSVTSADETKVLTVDSNGDWVAADAPSGLPSTTSANAGDVLSLNNNKEAVWATPSSGGVLVVHDVNGTLDKTWQEIHDAFLTGAVRITTLEGVYSVNHSSSDVGSNTFIVEYVSAGLRTAAISTYATNSADGYPVLV
jgi:hypothetical protein